MDSTPHPPDRERSGNDGSPRCQAVPVLRSEELFQGGRQVLILHAGDTYRLLRTRNDKLILQK
jgi:hemin uptake protein HemP